MVSYDICECGSFPNFAEVDSVFQIRILRMIVLKTISNFLFLIQFRIWDWFFYEGSIVLFQLTLGMLKMKEPSFKDLENSAQIFNCLSDIPGGIDDVDALFEISMEVGGVSLNALKN